jgi:TP901 family phage tail tape measure protein
MATASLRVGANISDFQKATKQMNDEMKTIDTSMKASAAQASLTGDKFKALSDQQILLSEKFKIASEAVQNQKSLLETLSVKQEQLKTKQSELSTKIEETNKKWEEAKTEYGKNSDQAKALGDQLTKLEKQQKSNESAIDSNINKMNTANKKLAESETQLYSTQKALKTVNTEISTFKIAELTDGLDKAAAKTDEIGKTLTLGVTVPIAALGTIAIKTGMDFEASMSGVKAISGATGTEFEKLNKLALQLGQDTAFSASEAANGMQDLASAGFTVNEIISAMPGMLDLAAAGGLDVASASDIASSAIRAFGLDASQSGHLADVFAEAAGATNANVTDMGEALKYAATPAYALGMSVEETSAAIGELANVGIKGSEAGTSLRGALISLASPSDTAAEAMQSIGFSAFDAQGQMLPFKDVIGNLQTSLGGLSQEEKANAVATIFGREAMSGMLALVEAGPGQYSTLTQSLETCDGAAAQMATTMQDNAKSSIEQMMGSLETASIKIEQVVAPEIRDIADKVGNLADDFSNLDPETKKIIISAVELTAALGPATLAISGVTKAGSMLIKAGTTTVKTFGTMSGALSVFVKGTAAATPEIAGMATAMSVLTGPIGLAVVGVTALTAAGVMVHEVWAKNRQLTDEQAAANTAFVASQNAVSESVVNNLKSRAESLKSSEDSAIAAKALADKIYDLADKQNKSAWEMQVLNGYVKEFNSIMPGANLVIDEQTGALNNTRQATDDLIASKTEQIRIEAIAEELTQNAKDQLETTRALNDAKAEQNKIDSETAVSLQKIIDEGGAANVVQQKTNELRDVYLQRMAPVNQSIDDLTRKQGDLNTEASTLNGLLEDPSGWAAYNNNTVSASDATVKFADGSTAKIGEFLTNAPIIAKQTGENTTTELSNALINGTPGVTEAAENIHRTVTQAFDPLPSQLNTLGGGAAASLGAAISSSAPQVGADSQLIYDTVTGKLVPLEQFGKDTGKNTIGGFQEGASDQGGTEMVVGNIVDWVMTAFRRGFNINSPSKKTHEIGTHVLQGFFNGLTSMDVGKFADNLVQTLLDAFNNGKVTAMEIFNSMGDLGTELLAKMGINLNVTTSSTGGVYDGDLASWINQAIAATGVDPSNFDHLYQLAMAESGGNPNAINDWDSNWLAGIPSMGLMQTIQSTFDAYSQGGSIWDPVANAIAAINYMIARYGSIQNTPLTGYATGTLSATPGLHWVGEHGAELMRFSGGETVYTNSQSKQIAKSAQEQKQPVMLQLMLQNGKVLTEYLIDDINNMLGVKTGLAGRGMA